MNLFNTILIAIRALLRNKMRSFLTVLGIIIGVGAVIAMVAIGEGAKAEVQKSFDKMGTNMLVIRPGATQTGGARVGRGLAAVRLDLAVAHEHDAVGEHRDVGLVGDEHDRDAAAPAPR